MRYWILASLIVIGGLAMSSSGGAADATRFSADPVVAKAPAAVHFTIAGGRGNYRLDFGDGTVVGPAICMEGSACPESTVLTHTYTRPGTFTATLTRSMDRTTIGSITIDIRP